ncbi:MAG: ferredoxin family protein [Anaerolineales bacterium]|nr:ferredoxin family protein [Chloroflexota bacterium]MBL6980810.1 ferredoxin family protein [Anaerolineales bacterium]
MFDAYAENTLEFFPDLCTGCGLCVDVCPHGVFAQNGREVELVRHKACMECGACQLNCPFGAIIVESGVGCAYAMIRSAITRQPEPSCGC